MVIALFLAAAQLGGSALSSIQQAFQQNVTFTQKDFVPYSERLRCAFFRPSQVSQPCAL